MSRFPVAWILMMLILCPVDSAYSSEFYQWTDENGVTHFANSLGDVPEKYRHLVKVLGSDLDPETTGGQGAATNDRSANKAPTLPAGDESGQLKQFEIPYQAYEGSARRVIIPVTFNDRVTVPMALDTGSPGMVISFELAAQLGVFSRDRGTLLIEAAGIGGVQPAILTIIDVVSVEDVRDAFVPTTVTASVSDAFEGLIGMDFLTNYMISIDSQKQMLVFQETPPSQDSRGGHDEAWWRKTFSEFRAARDHWKQLAEAVDGGLGTNAAGFAEFQAREAERLLQRLDGYASDSAVPRHWR